MFWSKKKPRFEVVTDGKAFAIFDHRYEMYLDFKSGYWWSTTNKYFLGDCWTEDQSMADKYIKRLNHEFTK